MKKNDHLISLHEAANILGFRHINSVIRFIKKEYLPVYFEPGSKTKKVKMSEVLNLALPVKHIK